MTELDKPKQMAYVGWDGEIISLVSTFNNMLVESGITDREFTATKLPDDRVKLGMRFHKQTQTT